ncbi:MULTISPECIES: bifunctional UDP-N-acetylglucosamine diphosphorylase/glucosamine-1-phosphate N-acetyltransferase GlmU [Anaerolinea]|uniref:bifunctional UDP-N-acetylglucosamine diphosphorylase/glucosamine-1-phosphate N-acetyltransferase GlmU n=1 Tax=Anaerolinea TaxID=233189 RepID=UPI00261BAB50|nr:bifunctional UDP-N-acetylglucosamine diphosphorylase/glucosamine-1-phosphate N-acetyltransferase GlmU [Anaerolinea thermophila]
MKVLPIILAAGQGVRMRSRLPKVLHPLAGRPLIHHALRIVQQVADVAPVVVIGHQAEQVRAALDESVRTALQEEQLGTGHAVMSAEALARGASDLVLITYGDMPLLRPETLRALIEVQKNNPGPLSLLTVEMEDPHGFGRIIRDEEGRVTAIVEEAVATPEQRAIRELNTGVYCIRNEWLWGALRKIQRSPKGEYYLTDLVEIAVSEGLEVQAVCLADSEEALGINTRVHLAEAEAVLRKRIARHWMEAGVTIVDPDSTYIEADVTIGMDTVIYPNTYLRGKTSVGENCVLGPDTIIEDSQIGNNCTVLASVIESSLLEEDVRMGPFCHLRPKAHLARGVKMGNFGEVKASYLGPGVHMGHFSYIGDAVIGAHTNIGAGTITCNFDGKNKHRTEIGEDAFIGSDTMLVAPVRIGARARTGAGSVVTHDVPDDETVIGVPARPFKKSSKESEH